MYTYTCTYIHLGIGVRLVEGSLYNEGRVEVYYNGEWGTVCDDGWDDTDAGVVCRQLGFGSSGTAIGSAGFGQGSGSIWLDSVTCTRNESSLASCGHLGVNITRNCSHSQDAGVRCRRSIRKYYYSNYCMMGNFRRVFISGYSKVAVFCELNFQCVPVNFKSIFPQSIYKHC